MGPCPGWVKTKTAKLKFAASPLSMQIEGVRTKTGSLGIGIMCTSGVACLPVHLLQGPSTKNATKHRDCRSHDRMVVGFTTTYAISAYHH